MIYFLENDLSFSRNDTYQFQVQQIPGARCVPWPGFASQHAVGDCGEHSDRRTILPAKKSGLLEYSGWALEKACKSNTSSPTMTSLLSVSSP
jgi:hypothetical protein